ncbi:MAG: hypothetical protein EOM66_01610 [Clostridia bacterium]|nr:hypothetical protein [Clostridia bacterium]
MKRTWLALALSLCMLLCACGKEEQASRYLGYTLSGEQAGGAPLAEANAYSMAIKESGETTSLIFQFKSGSRMSGTDTQKDAVNTLAYTIWMEENPARLMVRFEDLSYWDYERDQPAPAGLVLGSFRYALQAAAEENEQEATADNKDGSMYVCFQLAADSAFKAEEHNDSLTITLLAKTNEKKEKKEAESEASWYLVGDAFRDYCVGKLKGWEAFTPTYAHDLSHIVLVSTPYASDIEAELAKQNLLAQNPMAMAAEWNVAQALPGALPVYDEEARYVAVYEESVQRRNGQAQPAEVFLADGLYLSAVPHRLGGGTLYSKRITRGVGTDSYSFEQLYVRDAQGADKSLLGYEFATIERAAFSPDGRRLAVLERAAERTNLYIVDVEMREVTAELTQGGFGELVSAICWDSMGSVLFAVSGSGEMQVHAYDFNVPDETKRHVVVDKNGANEGYIGFCDGEVYFVQSEMENETIYRIKPEGGVRKSFHSGSAFALSPNNAFMAISAASGVSTVESANQFFLLDMRNGETKSIPAEFPVYEFLWSQDGSRIYYFEDKLSGGLGEEAGEDAGQAATDASQDPYPYTLWVYELATGESRQVCDLPGTGISVSQDPARLYFDYFDEETIGEKIRATYWIDADTPEESPEPQAEPAV